VIKREDDHSTGVFDIGDMMKTCVKKGPDLAQVIMPTTRDPTGTYIHNFGSIYHVCGALGATIRRMAKMLHPKKYLSPTMPWQR
jgi:hypothetical protein